jgi:predicted heme/steroid binding protein
MKYISRKDLHRYNGENGMPTYMAYQGKVYDVSQSWHWKDGRHQVLHRAGEDLTDEMRDAPHNDDLLERVPVIGVLID